MNDETVNARNPTGIRLTQEQMDKSFRESYWQFAIRYGLLLPICYWHFIKDCAPSFPASPALSARFRGAAQSPWGIWSSDSQFRKCRAVATA